MNDISSVTTFLEQEIEQAVAREQGQAILQNEWFTLTLDDDVGVLHLDELGRSVNTLSEQTMQEMMTVIRRVREDDSFRGLVIISDKPSGFIAGADLSVLRGVTNPEIARSLSWQGHMVLEHLEQLSCPVVAAIHGPALGGGLELALACDYRIVADNASTYLGSPEVKLGLVPAGGGTQRLPRLIGLQNGLDMLLTGRNVYVEEALSMGLIDETIHQEGLLRAACDAVRRIASGDLKPARGHSWTDTVIESTSLTRSMVYRQSQERLEAKTKGNYPAPGMILNCVRVGLEEGPEAGREAEVQSFSRLSVTPRTQALLELFFAQREAAAIPDTEPQHPVPQTIAVIGCGSMGTGIAQVSAHKAGISVLLDDRDSLQIEEAMRQVAEQVARKRDQGALRRFEEDQILQRIQPLLPPYSVALTPLVIEAIPEDLELKKQVLAELEAKLPEHGIIASNTSSIPIAHLAEGLQRPGQLVGMHYFSPVPKMPLLEVVRGPQTEDWVVDIARRVGVKQGKSVIVVRDGPGFYTTRVLAVYTNEALRMLEAGAGVEQIDEAMKAWGFPMGPLEVLDQVGLPVAAKITGVLAGFFQERNIPVSSVLARLAGQDWHGQTTGMGFYHYESSNGGAPKRGEVNTKIYGMLSRPNTTFRAEEIQRRLGLLFVNEAVRCLQEEILFSPRDGDLGAVLGLGFPPFRGGPFAWCDQQRPAATAERLKNLAYRFGEHYQPAHLLEDLARQEKNFSDY